MDGGFGLVWGGSTNPYRIRACDDGSDSVGLDLAAGGLPLLTKHYQGSLLALPRPWIAFTRPHRRGEGITHSGLDYVLCRVIMD